MSDVFHEQLVKRTNNSKGFMVKAITIAICVAVTFISLYTEFLMFFIVPILAVEVIVIIYVFRRQNVEFEYIVTNSELDIDKIFNKAKRKHLFTIDVKSIIVMAKYEDMKNSTEFSTTSKTIDASSGEINENTYGFVTVQKNKRVTVLIEPNEDTFKAMKMYLRGKIV